MRVRRVDQNSAMPIDALQRFRHFHPIRRENNDVGIGRLLSGPCDGTRSKIGDKIASVAGPLELDTTMV